VLNFFKYFIYRETHTETNNSSCRLATIVQAMIVQATIAQAMIVQATIAQAMIVQATITQAMIVQATIVSFHMFSSPLLSNCKLHGLSHVTHREINHK